MQFKKQQWNNPGNA